MALEPSSASTAPVTLPTTVPGRECSGTESAWYWGLSLCRSTGEGRGGLLQHVSFGGPFFRL